MAAGVFLLACIAPEEGRADETRAPSATVRVDYRASATCPSRTEFLDSVRRYTTKWRLVDDRDERAARHFVVALDRREALVRGTLDIEVGERTSQKVVSGPTCATVARALAVMVALVIDPGASSSDQHEEPTPAPEPEPPPEPAAPPIVVQTGDDPRIAPDRPASKPKPRRTRNVRPVASAPRWTFDVRLESSSAVTARSMAVMGAFVDLLLPPFGRTEASGLVGPSSVGLGLRQSLPSAIGVPGGSTEFLWSAATVRACPLRLRLRLLGDPLDVAPCVESNLGILQVESRGIPLAQRTTTYWFDGAVSALGVWHLPGPWVVTAELELVAPFTRRRFEVVELASMSAGSTPRSEPVSQAPALGVSAGVGLGFEL
ncbi:hypothetical protein AKJ09_05410 [Labilithrix luteola]|uniref:Uncharacterized protein n=1 Tax=Labilithrix luteola TaxID=1391654 RepID=A0A0K1PZE5_9BACT|nr:hypothetical protein [Labilithrix luteola]AKU98746.1 hypothetical protein AKJ09_05410 [Labilithrix luteola]